MHSAYKKMTAGEFENQVVSMSRGVKAQNRLHSHSFSTNIIRINSNELSKGLDITSNSEFMVKAFSLENEQAALQLHREINRLVHNYLCAVSTFVDHSRNFMKKHYSDTKFKADYDREIINRFNNDPLCKFVRDLRNYITHCGLPNSQMSLSGTNDHAPSETSDGKGFITAYISYPTAPFLNWGRWSKPAKKYLKNCDEQIILEELFTPHLEVMKSFMTWFDERFKEHHSNDFLELKQLLQIRDELESR